MIPSFNIRYLAFLSYQLCNFRRGSDDFELQLLLAELRMGSRQGHSAPPAL